MSARTCAAISAATRSNGSRSRSALAITHDELVTAAREEIARLQA